ncbi:MAG: NUDIX domain-containing protein [Chloroflexi bacterium]|nr:NUDIX domain-containing protein [Chloroflexota bacterium]
MPPHIRVSASAVIIRGGHILLVKFDDNTGPHYNLPGGGADPGETAEEACIREVYEEADARIDIGRLMLVREYEPGTLPQCLWQAPQAQPRLRGTAATGQRAAPAAQARPVSGRRGVGAARHAAEGQPRQPEPA